jgi:hypothetical protein
MATSDTKTEESADEASKSFRIGIVGQPVLGAGKIHAARDLALLFVVDLEIGVMPSGVRADNPPPSTSSRLRGISPPAMRLEEVVACAFWSPDFANANEM